MSPVEKQIPSETLIDQVRQALKASELPLICAGRGVMTHTAGAELLTLAETIAAPVVCTEYAQGAIDQDHSLFVGSISEWSPNPFVEELLAETDFVLAVGMRSNTLLTDILMEHGPKNTMLVALDDDAWQELLPRSPRSLVSLLRTIARGIDLADYKKSRRGPKKKKPKRSRNVKSSHVSTARLLGIT